MASNKGAIYAVGFLVAIVVIAGYAGAFNPQTWARFWAAPSTGTPSPTDPCAAYPGTVWDPASLSCKSSSVQSVYTGPATWTVTSRDGDSKAALALTNAVYWLMKPDGTYAGTPVQATGTSITIEPSYNGKLTLVIKYMTSTVGFVDAAKTVAQNPSYMKSPMYLKDVDTNGQVDQLYDLDVSWVSIKAGQTAAIINIDLISWNADTAVTITNISSPTGMNAAGDYHATGYIAAITETYQWNVQIIKLTSNATAGSFGTKFSAGTSTVKSFKLQGTGAQTNTKYGGIWTPSGSGGDFAFSNPSYDTANTYWEIFKAHSTGGAVDVSQVNYGMGFVNERQSGTTWLQFDVWIHTTGDLTASTAYYLTVSVTCTNPAGTQTTATLQQTYTG